MVEPCPQEITVESIINRYEAILLDAYGVLNHSSGAMAGAAKLIDRLNSLSKPYYILTNDASKLPATAAARYQSYGLDIDAESIISSGMLLKSYFAEQGLSGAACAVLGPPDSVQYVKDAGGNITPPSEPFDVLVVADQSGYPFIETVNSALSSLLLALDDGREVRLVLPNPDLIYPSAEQSFGFTAGAVAAMFESALRARYPHRTGLSFARLGKPNEGLFAEALRRSGTRNMVMIGDQLETDIQGAASFGLDTVWLYGRVMDSSPSLPPGQAQPTYRLRSLEGS